MQVFKTKSNVLNSGVNIVNIVSVTFCLLAVTKLAHWPMSSLRRRNTRYQDPEIEKAKTNDNCVTNYRAASPGEVLGISSGGDNRRIFWGFEIFDSGIFLGTKIL